MRRIEKILRVLLVVFLFIGSTHISPAHAANFVVFSDYGNELMVMDPAFWDLTSMSISGGSLIPDPESSSSASFVVDLSGIATAIDGGNLEISFSANAFIADEADELDLASITIGFGASSGAPSSTIVLDRTTSSPGSDLPLTSSASIPSGTRYLFVQPSAEIQGGINTASFSGLSLTINDNQAPSLNYSLNPLTWTNTDVEVLVTATDSDSGVEGIYNEASAQVSASASYSYTATDNGNWSFTARDLAGNVSDPLVVNVSGIDRLAPVAPVITEDTTDWSTIPVGFNLSDVIAEAGEAPVSRQYRLNSGAWLTYSEPVSVSIEGSVLVEARSIDQAQNASEIVQTTLLVDLTAPQIELTEDAHPQPVGGITITVEVTDATSGVAEVKYAVGSQKIGRAHV